MDSAIYEAQSMVMQANQSVHWFTSSEKPYDTTINGIVFLEKIKYNHSMHVKTYLKCARYKLVYGIEQKHKSLVNDWIIFGSTYSL